MAAINDLVAQVTDDSLREKLKREINRLAKQKKFGLVFESHLPEVTPLYDIPVKAGCKAMLRANKEDKSIYYVLKIDGDEVVCVRRDNTQEQIRFALKDLVRVAEFGESIYPYLQPIDTVSNAPESDLWHTLIEADNYHALQLLDYLYAGKVDCIYIDPPYNTGAKDWKYNNDYVDGNDAYRHSKWLSMMEKRLRLAKKLLNPMDSTLIITIDEKEYLHLGCLLEEMFPDATITMITDVINPRAGVARANSFTRSQEYIFFVQVGNSVIANDVIKDGGKKGPIWFSLMRTGSNSSRSDRPNLFYPIWVNEDGSLYSIGDNIPLEYDRNSVIPPAENVVAIWPLRPDGTENTWQLGRDTLGRAFKEGTAKINVHGSKYTVNYLRNAEKERIKRGEILVEGKEKSGALILKHNEKIGKSKAPDSVWNRATHDAGIYGSSLISAIFLERRFSFPKSLYATFDAIKYVVGNKRNALVLDFFAGSGTTLHAVNLLNALDGGTRRCILVTNNEVSEEEGRILTEKGFRPGDVEWESLGIAKNITWPRTVCSIKGTDIKGNPLKGEYNIDTEEIIPMNRGFKANAAFFKLGFLDKTAVSLGLQFRELLPILWMKAGAIGKCPEIENEDIPSMLILPQNNFAVLIDENCFAEFEIQLKNNPDIQTVYIVTDYEVNYRSMVRSLNVKETYQLYRDYLDNFRINHGRD